MSIIVIYVWTIAWMIVFSYTINANSIGNFKNVCSNWNMTFSNTTTPKYCIILFQILQYLNPWYSRILPPRVLSSIFAIIISTRPLRYRFECELKYFLSFHGLYRIFWTSNFRCLLCENTTPLDVQIYLITSNYV